MKHSSQIHAYVVDGQPESLREIVGCFPSITFRVSEFGSGAAAVEAIDRDPPHLILSEVRLPDCSGFSFCREIREGRKTQGVRVILLSHWATEMDRIIAFECGADDFIARPYSRRELTSRILAVSRYTINKAAPDSGNRTLESHWPDAASNDRTLSALTSIDDIPNLTSKEIAILTALIAADGRPLSREELIAEVWSTGSYPSLRCVDSHIKLLRRKLAQREILIETVRGVGYRVRVQPGRSRMLEMVASASEKVD